MNIRPAVILMIFFLLTACFGRSDGNVPASGVLDATAPENEAVSLPYPVWLRAAEIASSLDDRLLAAQVFISGIDGNAFLPFHIIELFTEYPPGGVMLFRYNLDDGTDSIKSLISQTVSFIKEQSNVPPFVAVDHEGGSVNRLREITSLPPAGVYWDVSLAQGKEAALAKIEADSMKDGRTIAALGINMNFAPVAEYLTPGNRGFLASRSYGSDPLFTAEAASAFIRGMESAGVMCVVKHFPGSTGPDPHYSLSVIEEDKAALDALVFPFAALIREDRARALMAAHSAVPAIDDKIASLSSVVMGNWLRGELGFNGLIICDDFSMAAAGNISLEEAAIQSIAAGADMILVWQQHLRQTHQALIAALEDDRLSRERLVDAATRVIYEKMVIGLLEDRN